MIVVLLLCAVVIRSISLSFFISFKLNHNNNKEKISLKRFALSLVPFLKATTTVTAQRMQNINANTI